MISDFLSTAPSDLDSSVFDLVSLDPVPRDYPFSTDLADDNFLSPVLSLAVCASYRSGIGFEFLLVKSTDCC